MSEATTRLKITLLIPLTDNEGDPFDLEIWSWWSDQLTSLVSGFTDHGMVTGWWRGYSDQNRMIVMIVNSMMEVEAIRNLLREARVRFMQEAMYLEYHDVTFEEVR